MKKTILSLLLATLMLLSACGSEKQEIDARNPAMIPTETIAEIQHHIESGLTGEINSYISGVIVTQSNNKVNVTVRTVAVGGSYIPTVAEIVVPLAIEKIEESGITLGDIMITEYSESNSGGISDMIAWRTTNGETGTFSDDSGESPVVKPGMTLEELTSMWADDDTSMDQFGDILDVFQGEWYHRARDIRLIINNNEANFVRYDEGIVHDVSTYYFDYDENGNLVVSTSYSKPYYSFAINDSGLLVVKNIHSDYYDSTSGSYEKISDNTAVPKETPDPAIGMSEFEIYKSTQGSPKRRNKTTTAYGAMEQWVYDDGYIYLENGIVTTIQEK